MSQNVILNHIALSSNSEKDANLFFTEILGIPLIKKFNISKNLANKIFKIPKDVEIFVYENNKIRFEIFITNKKYYKNFDHICLEIYNKKELIEKCKENNIEYLYANKDKKKLLFIIEKFGNLFEIK